MQGICGPGDTSYWAGPFTFTTPCSALIPSQLEDFLVVSHQMPAGIKLEMVIQGQDQQGLEQVVGLPMGLEILEQQAL